MPSILCRTRISAPLFSLGLLLAPTLALQAAHAADMPTTPVENARIDDFVVGKKAIDAKNWALAASSFSKVVAQNPQNADAYNLLGYSNRWLGKYDEAFAAYNKALTLDPRHKGALEYSGIAYLKVGQKAQAEAQLAKLQAICAQCEETTDLAKAVAAHNTK
ncbi:MAG: tetratricopeptide repeat protein [Gammaproteobacteria bacterium]|nr:tetratricopeptide repeat protein [Gammaproteobacteria bacterium]MBU0892191.1 tetratricopeptide repeat protein [Gammaproteobacteria bacterium]